MRFWLAIRAFFAVLFNARLAPNIEGLLRGEEGAQPTPSDVTETLESPADASQVEPAASSARNDAITLVATLQREARFVDIVKEPLGEYTDQQIGAAARDVLRDCGLVLDRLFAFQPVVEEEEDAELEAPADFDTGRYRLTGKVSGDAPFRGRLVHHGWQATRCELPQWSGSEQSVMVVAPVELEVC